MITAKEYCLWPRETSGSVYEIAFRRGMNHEFWISRPRPVQPRVTSIPDKITCDRCELPFWHKNLPNGFHWCKCDDYSNIDERLKHNG